MKTASTAAQTDYYCDRCQTPGLHVSCATEAAPRVDSADLQPLDKLADPDEG